MKKTTKYTSIALSILLFATSTFATETVQEEKTTTEHTKHWGYVADVAPEHWSNLNEKFKTCSQGKQQSPINVVATDDRDLTKLDIEYISDATSIARHTETGHTREVNNGHTVEIELASGNIFNYDDTNYELKQFHFHTPSENHIEGKSFPLEAHFVHASKEGKLAVIAVMFKEGEGNPTLGKILNQFPLKENKEVDLDFNAADLNAMMPKDKSYYKFMGSLTTPPCTEQVRWFVLKRPLTATKYEIEQMHKEIGQNNNRPIQEHNKRKVLK